MSFAFRVPAAVSFAGPSAMDGASAVMLMTQCVDRTFGGHAGRNRFGVAGGDAVRGKLAFDPGIAVRIRDGGVQLGLLIAAVPGIAASRMVPTVSPPCRRNRGSRLPCRPMDAQQRFEVREPADIDVQVAGGNASRAGSD